MKEFKLTIPSLFNKMKFKHTILMLLGISTLALVFQQLLLNIYLSKQGNSQPTHFHIHVVAIYENSNTRDSPLFYFPSCPSTPHQVTLHVFSNSNSTSGCILERFSQCPRLSFKFYNSKELSINMESTHYSAASANKKLKLLEFFQHRLNHFLYLDADTFLVHGFDDLQYVWEYLYKFTNDQFIGMVKEFSTFYDYPTYNSGVFLVDVSKSLKYPWKEFLGKSLQATKSHDLADQDVFNTLDRITNGTWVHSMECGLNFQHAGFENCNTTCVRVAHFNAMDKIRHTPYADKMLEAVKNNSNNTSTCEKTIFPTEQLFDWIGKPLTCN